MTFSTAIQTYQGAHAATVNTWITCAISWDSNEIWMGGTVSTVDYLSRYGLVSGGEEAFATSTSILSGITIGAVGVDSQGTVYVSGPNALGHGSITRVNGSSLTFISNSAYSAPNFGGTNLVALPIGASQYVLDSNVGNTVINLNNSSLSVDGIAIGSFGWAGGARCATCMGKVGTGRGYLLNSPGGGANPQHIFLQRIDLAHAAAATIGSYVPTDFDVGWTEAYAAGMCLDQTDGNLVACVFGVGNSNYNYVVKFNAATGAIIWKTLLTTTTTESIGGELWSQSRIRNQRLAFLQKTPANTIVVLNTADGSVVSTQTSGLAGLTIWGRQAYDDTKGVIIGMFDYSVVVGGPTPLNGSAGGVTGWAALYVTAAATTPGTPNGPATSRKRAWTFTLDGHTFYVLDLGAEGTWLYDKTTQTWSQWYTDTYTQWNVANGCMWGNRIVGGDLATSNVYEVAASNVQDNGAVDIPHCVTGGLVTRSRDGFSLDALLLSASRGELGDVAGSTVNMRFSDDNGETWSDYFPIPLANADYSQDLRWLSLGNFQAPGRIFEISDDGGPISLDGLDAFMDGFDDEQGPAQG